MEPGRSAYQSAPIGGIGFALATLNELVRRLFLKGPR
jgi:hypothetical protein